MNEDAPVRLNDDGTQMSLVDYMNQLELAPAPPPVSMWPQTGGWIWLGLMILVLAVWGVIRWRRARRETYYRRQALQQIATVGDDPAAIATILRRAALAAFPRREVAGLQGEAWLAFLDRTYGGDGFSNGAGSAIVRGPYVAAHPAAGLGSLAAQWVRHHRRPKQAPS